MPFVLASIRKDLSRWVQDRTAILLWLGIPFLIGGLITAMTDAGGGAKPHGILLLVDQDQTFISGLVAGAYGQAGINDLISVETVSLEEGNARIDAGEASGLLIVPEGFGQALLDSTPVTLTLKTNPSQTILPGIITDVTEILLDAGFYAHQLFGEEISKIANVDSEDVPEAAFFSALAISIQQKLEAAAPQLFPPAIEVTIAQPPSEQPGVPIALLFLPGIVMMALVFTANSLAGDFWEERELGTLRRLVNTPGRLAGFIYGKALAACTLIAMIGGITLVVGFLYHDLPWTRFPSSIVWVAVSGLGLFGLFSILQMIIPSKQAASLFNTLLVFPLLMAGGSFFPLAVMPDWIASIGRVSPNGFMADRLTTELTGASAWAIDPWSWLTALTLAAAGLALCTWRLHAGFARA